MLIAWWEGRHQTTGSADTPIELAGVLAAIGPTMRLRSGDETLHVPRSPAQRGRACRVGRSGRGQDGARVATAPEASPTITIEGSTQGWMAALVEGATDGLTIDGDGAGAERVLAAVRAAVLAYVR